MKLSQQVEDQTLPTWGGQLRVKRLRPCFDPMKKTSVLFHTIAVLAFKTTLSRRAGNFYHCPHMHKLSASSVPAFEREMLEVHSNVLEHMWTQWANMNWGRCVMHMIQY